MASAIQEQEKIAAARAALALIEPGMKLGLGTGSTASHFIQLLGQHKLAADIMCAASSNMTQAQGEALGLRFAPLAELAPLDLAIDGADELTAGLALIKGGGGALLRERAVVRAAYRFIVIADSSKQVAQLGKFPLPVEVARTRHADTARQLREVLGLAAADMRLRRRAQVAFVTDNNNYIYDMRLGGIDAPARVARQLESVSGVQAHGLFLDLATAAFVAKGTMIETLGDMQYRRNNVTI